jgi:hypothetical protein
MATRPIECPYTTPEGLKFNNGNLVLDNGSMNLESFLYMKDLDLDISTFARNKVTLKPQTCFMLTENNIGDDMGYVSFIIVKAIFPAGIVESKKYLEWTYNGNTNTMGELMILSGDRISASDSTYEGWDLSKPGGYTDGSVGAGGIIFCNTSVDLSIKLEMLIAR